jgi:ribosome modulation factor
MANSTASTVGRDILDAFAFSQGQQAFLDGYADDVNPYTRGTMLHEEWTNGWDKESNEHYREVESDELDRKMLMRRL